MMFCRIVPIVVVLFLLPGKLFAQEFSAGNIQVDHPWSMPLPPVSANGAAYITIENKGTEVDRMVGASSPIADVVEVHEHVHENGLMKMQQVEGGLELGSGEKVSFAPGGLHLMLIGLRAPLVEGQEFPLKLQFEHAGELEVVVQIGNSGDGEMGHSGHDMDKKDSDHSSQGSNQAD